jgi:hypothetical protein
MPKFSKREREDKAYWLAFKMVCELGARAPAQLRLAAREAKAVLADTKNRHADDDKKCVRHPLYKGKRKPKNNCRTCWRVYNALQE